MDVLQVVIMPRKIRLHAWLLHSDIGCRLSTSATAMPRTRGCPHDTCLCQAICRHLVHLHQILPPEPGTPTYLHDGLQAIQQLDGIAVMPIGPRRVVPNHNLPGRPGGMQLPLQAPQLRVPVLAFQAPCKQPSQLSANALVQPVQQPDEATARGQWLVMIHLLSELARWWADG